MVENIFLNEALNKMAIEKSMGRLQSAEEQLDFIEKAVGRGAPLGEVRTWNGKEYIKTPKGWRPKPKGFKDKGQKDMQQEYKQKLHELATRAGVDKDGNWNDVSPKIMEERNKLRTDLIANSMKSNKVKVAGSDKMYEFVQVSPNDVYQRIQVKDPSTGDITTVYEENVYFKNDKGNWSRVTDKNLGLTDPKEEKAKRGSNIRAPKSGNTHSEILKQLTDLDDEHGGRENDDKWMGHITIKNQGATVFRKIKTKGGQRTPIFGVPSILGDKYYENKFELASDLLAEMDRNDAENAKTSESDHLESDPEKELRKQIQKFEKVTRESEDVSEKYENRIESLENQMMVAVKRKDDKARNQFAKEIMSAKREYSAKMAELRKLSDAEYDKLLKMRKNTND